MQVVVNRNAGIEAFYTVRDSTRVEILAPMRRNFKNRRRACSMY